MSEAMLYRWDDMPAEQLSPTILRKFVTGQQCMFARLELKKGCQVPEHSHPNEQISFIASGSLRFRLGDGSTRIVSAGEVLVIPGNLPHSAEALEDTLDFDVFAPPRADWIAGTDAYLRSSPSR